MVTKPLNAGIHMRATENKKSGMTEETVKWVKDVLEPDQLLSAKRRQHLGRQKLKLATVIVLWALRVYVVIMLFLVVFQIWVTLHS
jgi:hypothetical protein